MKKVILKLELQDDHVKQKAMERVSGVSGVDSVSMDMKEKKLTVIGEVDPIKIVKRLRRICHTEIVSVGPAKEPEKKPEPPKKAEAVKKDEDKIAAELVKAYQAYTYNPYTTLHHNHNYNYNVRGFQENPNECVIC